MKKLSILLILTLMISMVGCTDQEMIDDYDTQIDDLNDYIDDVEDERGKITEDLLTLQATLEQVEENNQEISTEYESLHEAYTDEVQRLETLIDGYESQIQTSEMTNPWDYELHMVSGSEQHIWANVMPSETHLQIYNVIGNDIEIHGESLEYDQIDLGASEYSEGIRVIIYGTVLDFRWNEVIWNDDYTESTLEPIESLGTITNTIIDIYTILPEGLPWQAVSWKTDDGESHEFFISYDGVGHSGMIILP